MKKSAGKRHGNKIIAGKVPETAVATWGKDVRILKRH